MADPTDGGTESYHYREVAWPEHVGVRLNLGTGRYQTLGEREAGLHPVHDERGCANYIERWNRWFAGMRDSRLTDAEREAQLGATEWLVKNRASRS